MLCCILFVRDASSSRLYALRGRLFRRRARPMGADAPPSGDPHPSPGNNANAHAGAELDLGDAADSAAILGAALAGAPPRMPRDRFQPGLVRLIGESLRSAMTQRGPREGSARW
ncbi:hypothetical protein OJF2_01590 [Aquisphaera giovannonii]|uniref:Uncharacterized protein n=1 Tax=Aquisphaera giovannonii TaxID=406548 RepID=A0A5B9VUD2_9BACT|nr:hypothetical protein [Aquisphaera giovannonii]QEH31694.1 hypothetical protein OJF2_01590 [Aquisphaera giovannonii]